jgi:pyruvate kinase
LIATLGPATAEVDTIAQMLHEGVRVVRINFSHGGFDWFAKALDAARAASEQAGLPLGILGDLSGPKIRVLEVAGDSLQLVRGDHVEVIRDLDTCYRDPETNIVYLGTTYDEMVEEVEEGQRLLINDGAIRLLVTEKVAGDDEAGETGPRLVCSVTTGGELSAKKGVNLPETRVGAPSLTEWDRQCVKWSVENGLDFLALSFVRRSEDVVQLRELLKSYGRRGRGIRQENKLPIISKIEKPQAIEDLDGVLNESDAVMVARGDLGVEMDLAEVPVLQKRIIKKAHDHGKPVIVATQMLESMIDTATPTRAEVSDVANAIFDGADAVMLSGETAVGQYPVDACRVMHATAKAAESYLFGEAWVGRAPKRLQETRYRTAALAHGVSTIVGDLRPLYVVMWSELGGGARYLSQNRLPTPILAVSSNPVALRQMTLMFGVRPVEMPRPEDSEAFVGEIDRLLLDNRWAEQGDAVVIVKGEPLGTPGVTNKIRIHYVGDVCKVSWHVAG